jgi:hypothetical protein
MIRQTFYPGGGAGHSPVGIPGTDRRASGCIQYLAKVFNGEVPDSSEFFVRVDRVGPAMWEGQRLPLGPIESRLPIAPYPDLHETIRSIHGGGEYQLRVFDAEGRQQHQMKFSVDVLRDPPNSRLPGMVGYTPAALAGAHRSPNPLMAINQDGQEDLAKLRLEEQRLRAEQSTMMQAASLEDTKDTLERNRRARRESEDRRTMGPHVEGMRAEMNATIKDLIRDNQLQQERMMNTLKELVASSKPQDNSSALMMAETMKAMTAMVAAVLSGANKPPQTNELSEAIKMTQAANEKVVTMAIQSATAQAGKNDALITQLITNRLESPDSAVKQALEMRENGWQQAMQMFQMMESMRGDAEADQVINPEGGFLGNLGNVLLSALSGMMKGGGGGNKILETIAQNLGKQPGQLSQQDLRYAAQKMEQARPQLPVLKPMQLPAPQPQQQAQPQRMVSRTAPGTLGLFDAIYETVEIPQAQPGQQLQMWPMPIPVEALRPTPQETFAVLQGQEITEELVVEPVAVVQAPAQQAQVSSGSESLDHLVGEAVQIALEDISSERRVHDWVEFAVDKWPKDFLRAIAQAPNDEERLKLLQHHCVPSLFKQFFDLVTDLNKQSRYLNFVTNLHALVEEINKEVVGAA